MNNLLSFLMLLPVLCFSQDRDGVQVMVSTENDSFAYFLNLRNDDDHYTGGAKIEVFAPEWEICQPFIPLKGAEKVRSTYGMTVTAYTPQNLGTDEVQYGDRPYASFTAFSFGKEYYKKNAFLKSELYLGLVGLDWAKNAQTYIHDGGYLGTIRPVPDGWHHQIGNEDVFVFNYAVNYLRQIEVKEFGSQKKSVFGAFYRLETNLGNYMTDIGLGLNLAWNVNTSPFIGVSIPKKKDKNEKDGLVCSWFKKDWFRMNFYVEPKLRHVLHNSTLEGTLFGDDSVYTIDHSDVRRYQFECSTGVNFTLWDTAYLGAVISGRSQEFKGAKDIHFWGGISAGFRIEKRTGSKVL